MVRIMTRRKIFRHKEVGSYVLVYQRKDQYLPLLDLCFFGDKKSLRESKILQKLLDKAINQAEIWKKNSKIDWE